MSEPMNIPATKPRVAVVGAGVAGISAAYHLREHAEITLFERDERVGGHAHTIEVTDAGRTVGLDTAFVVFNRPNYPNLTKFFDELGVGSVEHLGGFNFYDLDSGLEFGSDEMSLPEEEVIAQYGPEFQTIWREAQRFHQEGRRDFFRKKTDMPLGEYLDRGGYSQEFRYGYVVLLCTAVWSVPAELIWEMPATTVIAFFMAHDEGGLGGKKVDWCTVEGGSVSYVRKAMVAIDPKLRNAEPVTGVRQDDDGAVVTTVSGSEKFDYVVMAVHGDEVLGLLGNPTTRQKETVQGIRYNSLTAILHTDAAVMSSTKERWQSWNYGKVTVDGKVGAYVTYYMNMLHGFTSDTDYFLTLDYPGTIREDAIIRTMSYSHPLIDMTLRNVQKDIHKINEGTRVKLCGSYFHSKQQHYDQIGSHEAGFSSGKEAAAQILRELHN